MTPNPIINRRIVLTGGAGGFPQESDILALSPLRWWKPDEGRVTKDGGDLISQVNDISGNAGHFTQGIGTERYLWVDNVLNGRAAMRASDVDNNMDFATISPPGNYTIFMVFESDVEINAALSTKALIGSTGVGWFLDFGIVSALLTNETLSTVNTSLVRAHYLRDVINTDPHILMARLDGTTGTISIDRDSKTIFNSTAGGLDASVANARMTNLSRVGHATVSAQGDLFETIIFDAALSDDDVSIVENYFTGQFRI